MIVVDASLLSAFILGEPGWENLAKYLKHCYSVNLIVAETSNAIWKHYKRNMITFNSAVKKFKVLKKMINVNVILVNEDTLIEEAFNLSVNKDITVYDSLYLALSLEKKAPLATLDEKQRKVAKELSLKVLP